MPTSNYEDLLLVQDRCALAEVQFNRDVFMQYLAPPLLYAKFSKCMHLAP